MRFLRPLPLALTLLRLLMGPLFVWLHGRAGPPYVAMLAVVAVGIATDWLDGFLARRWQAVSNAGKLLDPFADALFCMLIFGDYASRGLLAWWVVAILIAREAVVTFVLRPVALRGGIVVAAGALGKAKTVVQFIAIVGILVMKMESLAFLRPLAPVVTVSTYAMLLLSVVSAWRYAVDVRKALGAQRGAEPRSGVKTGGA